MHTRASISSYPQRWVNGANSSSTGPFRRSARLHARQNSTRGEEPTRIAQLASLHKSQTETSAGTVPLPSQGAAEEQEQLSPATQPQHRQTGGEHRLERAPLTRKNLAQFDKMGKKKGTNTAPTSTLPESTTESTTTKTASTTMSGFAVQVFQNGVLDPPRSEPPTNLEEILERYAESRGTASPSESVYEEYVGIVEDVGNEATMLYETGPYLLKRYKRGYKKAFNQAFTGFPKNVGFNNGLSAP